MKRSFPPALLAPLTGVALLGVAFVADAARVTHTEVDVTGDLHVRLRDRGPPNSVRRYTIEAFVSAVYVCADPQMVPMLHPRYRMLVRTSLEREIPLTVSAAGTLDETVTLDAPDERVNLTCPTGKTPQLAVVRYIKIWVHAENAPAAPGRDVWREFIPI